MQKDCRVKLPNDHKSRSSNNKKRDISTVRCSKCNQLGHYANKYPNASKSSVNQVKKVTFESAHVTKEGDESCKQCTEIVGNISKFQNNFCFKFQNSFVRGHSTRTTAGNELTLFKTYSMPNECVTSVMNESFNKN